MLKLTFGSLWARSYATWQAPGSTVIRVSSLVMHGIYTEVMKEFDAIAERGTEAGGILLGGRAENEIVIDDFEAVLSEHRFGPCFHLSSSDRETLERFRKRKGLSIVGWYRSETRQEFALGAEDRRLLDNELQRDRDVTLLIKPGRSQPYEVKLFFREEGRLQEAPQTTRFPFDRPATSLRDLLLDEPPVAGVPTARTQAQLSRVEQQLSNPTIDGPESFDPGYGNTSREVHPAASGEPQEPQYPSAASAAARELEDNARSPSVEREPEPPLIQPASEHEEATALVMREAEPVCVAGPPLLAAEAPKPRAEFAPIGPLARKRLLAEQPPQERRRRKWTFMIGALLLTAIGGTLGYFSIRPRPTASASTRRGKQVSAPAAANQIALAPRSVPASPKQPAATDSTVLVKVERRRHSGSIFTGVAAAHAGSIRKTVGGALGSDATAAPLKQVIATEGRSPRNPLVQSGRELPFTCSAGDVFHQTDAPPGWDTFACHGKNVWSLTTTQAIKGR